MQKTYSPTKTSIYVWNTLEKMNSKFPRSGAFVYISNEARGFSSRFLGLHSSFYGRFMAIGLQGEPLVDTGTENQGHGRVPTLQKSRR